MSAETQWLESFTGVAIATGAAIPGVNPEADAARFELKRAAQARWLQNARLEMANMKGRVQDEMGKKIKAGKLKGQRLLKEVGTQIEEIEASELKLEDLEIDDESTKIIGQAFNFVSLLSESATNAQFSYEGQSENLFTKDEVREEIWTPLMRERLLPESWIPAVYSETQRMLDETNAAYLARVEQEKAAGTLTPRLDRKQELLNGGFELLTLAGDMAGKFGAGTEQAKLAVMLLNTSAAVLKKGGEMLTQIGDGKYADASASAFDTMGAVAGAVLGGFGVDAKATTAVTKAFTAGSKAILVGNAFAKGIDGAEEGLSLMGGVVQAALEGAIAMVDDPAAKQGLLAAKATVPALFKQAAIGMNLRQKILDKDYAGIVECLGLSFQNVLSSVQELRALNDTKGKSEAEQKKIQDRLEQETKDIEKYGKLGAAGLTMAIKAALAAKSGEYMTALNGVIDGIGAQLTVVLESAGVDPKQAQMIGNCYIAASSAPKALQCLTSKDFDVPGALDALSSGIVVAFKQAAPNNAQLQDAGAGLVTGLKAIGSGINAKKQFDEGDYQGAVSTVIGAVQTGVKSSLDIAKLSEVKAAMEGADATELAGHLELAAQEIAAARKQAAAEEARAEAEDLLAEAQADADDVSEAQRFGAEASSIDKLVAKLQRDRMVRELATQIAQGGAAFLAKFVPVLGAVSAGIKLAAQLHAAGLRAQQLYRWVQSQDDLEKAQSSLSSSAGNFVRNQGEQLAHYSAQALFAAAQLAAEITKLTGVATAVGAGLDAAATAGAKIEEVARNYYRKEDLEHAWNVTAKALRSPANRKLGLEARRLNPSLAKYSMAWGAHTLKDPLAKNALRACNLTEASFRDLNTDVDKIVNYLETFYADDLKLYRELDEAPKWIPAELTLSLPSWTRLKRNAVTEGKLVEIETGRVDGALAELDVLADGPAWDKFKEAHLAWTKLQAKTTEGTGGTGGLDDEANDNSLIETALEALEIEIGSKKRLIAAVKQGLNAYVPTPAPGTKPEVATASAKAMNLATKVLLDQAGILAKAAETEMQSVVELRQQLLPA